MMSPSNPNLVNPYGGMLGAQDNVFYMFSPQQFTRQARRPYVYQFDDRFVHRAAEAVTVAASRGDRSNVQRLTQTAAANVLGPSGDNMQIIGLDYLSNSWTFMLIINKEVSSNPGRFNGNRNTRTIYYGYFIDEPVNPVFHGAAPTVNPNAMLVVTHRTTVNQLTSFGPSGGQMRNVTASDIDVVVPGVMEALAPGAVHLQTPSNLTNAVDFSGGNMYSTVGEYTELREGQPSITVPSKLSIPKANIGEVLGAAVSSAEAIAVENNLSGAYAGGMLNNLGVSDTFTSMFQTNLKAQESEFSQYGLNLNEPIYVSTVVSRYDPLIQPWDLRGIVGRNAVDQSTTNASNLFSSLLCSVIPAQLAAGSMLTLAFIYDSFQDEVQGLPPKTEHFETLMPMSDYQTEQVIRAVYADLRQSIFPMMKNARGHFHLIGSFTCGGVNHCTLNFYDDAGMIMDPYEVPGIFGGLTSSLIGDGDVTRHNGFELATLLNSVSGVDGSMDMMDSFASLAPPAYVPRPYSNPLQDDANQMFDNEYTPPMMSNVPPFGDNNNG